MSGVGSDDASAEPVAAVLGRFAAGLRFEDVPRTAIEHAMLLLVDSLGAAFAASGTDFAHRALGALRALGDGAHPVIATATRLSLRDAALMNGLLIHGLDFDDTQLAGVVHVSASALPVALGVAAADHLSGCELLLGYVLGAEITSRVAAAAGGGFHRAGFHATGVAGAFGAAVGAGRLRALSPAELTGAQGFALSVAAGSMQFAEEGAWTKRMHPGWAAAAGITAAAFAKAGFVSPQFAYEGTSGLYRTHLPDEERADIASITRGLGGDWLMEATAVKLHPTCHFTHTAIEAAAHLAANGLRAGDVAEISCLVHRDYIPVVCEPHHRKVAPASDYEAKFSLPYAVAVATLTGGFTLADLEPPVLADPQVLELARRVTYRVDPDSAYPAMYSGGVIVRTASGTEVAHRIRANRGSAERPVTASEIIQKFHDNMAFAGVGRARAEEILHTTMTIDACVDAAAFAELLAT